MVHSFAKCLAFYCLWVVANLKKHMPYKCTMIIDFLYTNCYECDVCAFIRILFKIWFQSQWRIYVKISHGLNFYLMSNGFMDFEGLSFHIIKLQTQSSGYRFVCESFGWNYSYLGLQFCLNYYSIKFSVSNFV
jgi:hypothetical protein